jgi:hypothetical protein
MQRTKIRTLTPTLAARGISGGGLVNDESADVTGLLRQLLPVALEP